MPSETSSSLQLYYIVLVSPISKGPCESESCCYRNISCKVDHRQVKK